MTTQQDHSQADQVVLDRVRGELMSGRTFALRESSHRSRYGYMPPISARDWAEAMGQVAALATQGDALAQVAAEIRINLYGDASQAAASVWEAIGRAVLRGYDDVVGRAAPDASGPRSAYQRPYTLAERLLLVAWGERIAAPFASSVPGVGWAIQRIAAEENVRLPMQGMYGVGQA